MSIENVPPSHPVQDNNIKCSVEVNSKKTIAHAISHVNFKLFLLSIVKLGKASEAARESVVDEEGTVRPSDTLLASYAVTPSTALRTPRTPMAAQDNILHNNFLMV